MNETIANPYDGTLSLVKALTCENESCEDESVVIGFYYERYDTNSKKRIYYVKEPSDEYFHEVNPYTICRNSGIKDKNGEFIFEYDLLKLNSAFGVEEYGYLVWDEFNGSWKIRKFTEFECHSDVDRYSIEVTGNIILSDEDAKVIFIQDEEEKKRHSVIDNSYCPSCFKK